MILNYKPPDIDPVGDAVADTGFHEGWFQSNNARGARAKKLRPRPQGG